jgi:predicted enzyme related to lactoylglutathione lyase
MIKYVNFVTIPVTDQKRALEFYTKRLGLTVFTDQPMGEGGQRWIELKIPGAQTKLVLFTTDDNRDQIGKSAPFTLNVDDLDRTHAELREAGVEFVSPPKKEPWGSYATLLDSEGNKLLLSQA